MIVPVLFAVGANVAASGAASATSKYVTRKAGWASPNPLAVSLVTAAALVGVGALATYLKKARDDEEEAVDP